MTKNIMRVTVVWSDEGLANDRTARGTSVFEKAGFEPHGLVVFDNVAEIGAAGVVVYPWWTILRVRIGGE